MLISDNPLLPNETLAIINVAEKGYLTLTLTATGEGGHSSRPPPESTIGRLSAALVRIEDNPFPHATRGPCRRDAGGHGRAHGAARAVCV